MSYEGLLELALTENEAQMSEYEEIAAQGRSDAKEGFPPQQLDDVYLEAYMSTVRSFPRDMRSVVIYPSVAPERFYDEDDAF